MFGSRLKAAMKAAGMDTLDVAQLCFVRPETVRKWLKRKDAPRPAQNIACIARVTGTDLMKLIFGESTSRKYSKRRGLFCLPK